MKKMTTLVCLLTLCLASCKQNQATNNSASDNAANDNKTTMNNLKFTLSAIQDPLITKGEAILFLLPEDWKYEGKVDWDFSNNTAPANIQARFYSADESVQYINYPTQFYIQQSQMMAMSGMGIGGKYLGCTIVANGISSAETTANEVLQKLQALPNGTSFSSVKSVPSQNQADIDMKNANPHANIIAETVVMQGACQSNTGKFNVYVICTVTGVNNPQLGLVYWLVRPEVFLLKEDANKAKNESVLTALYKSFRPTKNFTNCSQQVSQMLSNNFYGGVREAGAISQQISRNNDAMIASIDAQFRQSGSSSSSSSNSGFNDYIKGVDNYKDAEGYRYELPSSYNNAWKNGNGEIILSNEHGFDPNVGSTQNWVQLSK
jgi:hypothetical protein